MARKRRKRNAAAAQSSDLPPSTALIDHGEIAQPQERMEEMASDLWSGLPSEIEERMLSFLSVPDLCRFRTVCKRWNSLICSPRFGALCVQNASAPNFLVARCVGEYGNILGWRFLDLNARRSYTIKHDIKDLRLYGNKSFAMDGGLVCAYCLDPSSQVEVVVSNPIAKTSRRLPPPPSHPENFQAFSRVSPVMDMVVNNGTQEYKIFLMPSILQQNYLPYRVQTFRLDIYESTTNQWRSSTKSPRVPGFRFRVWCSVILEGMLYILISPLTLLQQYWQLWSYNPVEDAWKHTGAKLDTRTALLHPQLIVANNRLYLAAWVIPGLWDWNDSIRPTFDIMEILLVEGVCTKVSTFCRRAELEMRREFKIPRQIDLVSIEICRCKDVDGYITAFGFGKCIVLISGSSGISVEIDLETCGWELLPLKPLPCDHGLWCVKPMNLILPSVTWSQRGEENSIV